MKAYRNTATDFFTLMLTPPKRRWQRSQMPDESPIPLTPQALARMKDRLARIKASLPALAEEAARTAAYGDRSDSSEYKEAKSLLRRANRQVLTVEDQLKRVVVIKVGPDASGTVQLGSTVVLESANGNGPAKTTFQILGPFETDPGAGRISHKSPLGAALMDRKKGDTVKVQTANGPREYRILDIK